MVYQVNAYRSDETVALSVFGCDRAFETAAAFENAGYQVKVSPDPVAYLEVLRRAKALAA